MKCKYCNSENLILEKRSKDDKHILDAQQVALICGDCGKYIKWCPKDERKFYWLKTNKKIGTLNKIEEFDKLMAEYNCQDVYELVKAMQHQLAEKDKELLSWKDGTMIVKYEQQLAEKDKEIEKLKDKMETWQSELFDKLAEVTQIIDDYSVEIPMGDKTPSLMLIGSKEFEKDIDEIIDKFCR